MKNLGCFPTGAAGKGILNRASLFHWVEEIGMSPQRGWGGICREEHWRWDSHAESCSRALPPGLLESAAKYYTAMNGWKAARSCKNKPWKDWVSCKKLLCFLEWSSTHSEEILQISVISKFETFSIQEETSQPVIKNVTHK